MKRISNFKKSIPDGKRFLQAQQRRFLCFAPISQVSPQKLSNIHAIYYNFHVVGSIQTSLKSVTPFTVALSGKWVYTFSPDSEQLLAQRIQGDSPAKARAYLLKTGVISYAGVPNTLPSADLINFLVLVG